MIKQFDVSPINGKNAASLSSAIIAINDRFAKVAQVLTGATVQDVDVAAVRKTVKLGIADLTRVVLTGDAVLVLDTASVRAGVPAYLELAQDAVGGHVPTWVNATGEGGFIIAPSPTPESRTMYTCIYNGASWILFTVANGYTTASSDRAVEAALARLASAMLPLPRIEVLDADYAIAFDA